MINSLRVKNLRSILDSGDIDLRRINIVLGKNSVGKSTLVRTLPLLRQSTEQATKGPILWFGRLVDFGSFQNSVNVKKREDGITFEFVLSIEKGMDVSRLRAQQNMFVYLPDDFRPCDALPRVRVSISLGNGPDDKVGHLRSVEIDLGSDQVSARFSRDALTGLSVSGEDIDLGAGRRWINQAGKFIPLPQVARLKKWEIEGKEQEYWTLDSKLFKDQLLLAVTPLFHKKTKPETIEDLVEDLTYGSEAGFFAQLQELSHITSHAQKSVSALEADDERTVKIRRAVLLSQISKLFRYIDREICEFAGSVRYVEPVRAIAERYYRLQDLAVDEIDSRGANSAMFINSLSRSEQRDLKEWTRSRLGFYAYVDESSGHVQVKISSSKEEGKNIADLGFGYSQLLPIVLQLWHSTSNKRSAKLRQGPPPLLAIEQPELHLHPQFQAQIADVISSVIRNSEETETASFMIETHSEHLVNRFGHLISKGNLNPEDIQVLIVETDNHAMSTVKCISFDANGFLGGDWPSGFFVPELPR